MSTTQILKFTVAIFLVGIIPQCAYFHKPAHHKGNIGYYKGDIERGIRSIDVTDSTPFTVNVIKRGIISIGTPVYVQLIDTNDVKVRYIRKVQNGTWACEFEGRKLFRNSYFYLEVNITPRYNSKHWDDQYYFILEK
jgi:hypothetical protein